MGWIKRNLFFFIGAVIAVGLLGAAGYYDYQNWQHNKQAFEQLHQTYATLRGLNDQKYLPGNGRVNNIAAAREQEKTLHQWIERARKYFQPIPPVPNPPGGVITDSQFASARDHTLSLLQSEATNASVALPPQYGFSFAAERSLVKFAPGSLKPLAQQLGEVKALCEILYAAKVNALDSIRRVPVSSNDTAGPQADYLSQTAQTNGLAVFTPYQITFRGFSQNLASVMARLASSPHGFIVKAINVQPASGVSSENPAGPQTAGQTPAALLYYELAHGRTMRSASRRVAPAPTTSGGLKTVLNEQLLSITLEVEIVKLLPGK